MVLTMDTPQDLMSLRDAAKEYSREKIGAIGIKYATLYSWVTRGELRHWRQGEKIFVSRAEVEAMIRPKPAGGSSTEE